MTFRIEHRIGVAAPADVIWRVVSDFHRWGEWNPIYPKIEGRLGFGGPVTFELRLPNRPPQTLSGVIQEWVPDNQLIWTLKLMGGLVRTTRYFEIESLSEASCIFSNGEIFDGLGSGLMPKKDRALLQRAFEQVNAALKTRAESIAQAQGVAP